jgi:signal transduction histidine kinase
VKRTVRAELTAGTAAITAMVVIALVVPLGLVIRRVSADEALSRAGLQARSIGAVVASGADAGLVRQVVDQANATGSRDVTVWLPDGSVVGPPAAVDDAVRQARSGRSLTADAPGGRAVYVPVDLGAGGVTVVRVLVTGRELRRGVAGAEIVLAAVGLLVVAAAAAVADRLARAVVTPVRDLEQVAVRLRSGERTARVVPGGPREIEAVGTAVNALADRIDALLRAEREASADISHSLRTPLTALRMETENMSDPAERERLGRHVDELERSVTALIDKVREAPNRPAVVAGDLVAAVTGRLSFWQVLAEDQGRVWTVSLGVGPIPVGVGTEDLHAVVDALLTNVFAYTPDGSAIKVSVSAGARGGGGLVVEDAGPGMPTDATVTRGSSGAGSSGLGLDIVRRTAQRSGGGLRLARSNLGGVLAEVNFGPPGDGPAEGDVSR